jgi:hypothetical protein
MQANKISKNPKIGSHQYVIKYILSNLKKLDTTNERWFSRSIKDLKQFRLESDYENIEISLDKSNKAFKTAQELRDYITKNFKV